MELASIVVFVLCLKGVQVREIFSLHERKDHNLEKDISANSAIYAYDVEHERDHLNIHVFVNFESRNALSNPESLWEDERIPYELSEKYDSKEKSTILAAIEEFKNKTCIRFEPREGEETPFILIEPGSGCSATVGRTQEGRMSISEGCYSQGIILHELMHVLGFLHEHSRPDRDEFVSINWKNIQEDFKGNFKKNSLDEVEDGNITYDYGSLMHYAENNFAKNRSLPTITPLQENVTIGQREAFSEKDIERIWLRYGCGKKSKAAKGKSTQNTPVQSTQKTTTAKTTTKVRKSSKASENTRKTSSTSITTKKATQSVTKFTTSSSAATVKTQNTPSQSISTETAPLPETELTPGVPTATKTMKSTPFSSTRATPPSETKETLGVQKSSKVTPSQSTLTQKATPSAARGTSGIQKSSTATAVTSKRIAGSQQPKLGIKSLLRYWVTTIYREGNGRILPRLINIFTKRTTQQGSAGSSDRRKRDIESPTSAQNNFEVEAPEVVEHKLVEVDSPIVAERRKEGDQTGSNGSDLEDFRSDDTSDEPGSNTPMDTSSAFVDSQTPHAASDRTTADITNPDFTLQTNLEKEVPATVMSIPGISTSSEISTESEDSEEVNLGTNNLEQHATTIASSNIPSLEILNPIGVISALSPRSGRIISDDLAAMNSSVVTLTNSSIAKPEDSMVATDAAADFMFSSEDSIADEPDDSITATPEIFIVATDADKNVVITADSTLFSSEDSSADEPDDSTIATPKESIVADDESAAASVDSTVGSHDDSTIGIPEVAIVAADESVHSDSASFIAEDSAAADIEAVPLEVEVRPVEHFHIIHTLGLVEGRTALSDPSKLWPGGVVPYEFSDKYDATQRRFLLEGMEEFKKKTCVTFQKREGETTYIFIEPEERCKAPVGRQPGKSTVTLSEGCYLLATILHELMHVLGFIHEQNRPDRDDFVAIQWDNIIEAAKPNFLKSKENEVTTLGVGYDYDSVMHYSANEFAKDPAKPTIVPLKAGVKLIDEKEGFSRKDILKINKLYNCPAKREISGRQRQDEYERRDEEDLLQKLLKYFELNFQRLFRSILRTIQRFRPGSINNKPY